MNIVKPGKIKGTLSAPSSKSVMQRVVALATLAHEDTIIENPSLCDDGLASLQIAEGLGANVKTTNGLTTITPRSKDFCTQLSCHESGTAMRIFSAVAATFNHEFELTAIGTLRTRPMAMIQEPLTILGAQCRTSQGLPPLLIKGPLSGGKVTIDGSVTSQFLSGLLLALPLCENDSEITVTGLKSKPYVIMTLDIVRQFGGTIEGNIDSGKFFIPGGQKYTGKKISIEGDWSGASSLLVAGAIAGEITLWNLSQDSLQADKIIIEALQHAGAFVEQKKTSVTVSSRQLTAFEFDASDTPDLFPPLVALASACKGKTRIKGSSRLIHKESNRARALIQEFGKMGIAVSEEHDALVIEGGTPQAATLFSHHDHRIAMACAVGALRATGESKIEHAECVSKSYPDFFKDLQTVWSH